MPTKRRKPSEPVTCTACLVTIREAEPRVHFDGWDSGPKHVASFDLCSSCCAFLINKQLIKHPHNGAVVWDFIREQARAGKEEI